MHCINLSRILQLTALFFFTRYNKVCIFYIKLKLWIEFVSWINVIEKCWPQIWIQWSKKQKTNPENFEFKEAYV